MLEALKAFMPVDEQGLGSITYSSEQRKEIAKNTRGYQCPVCNQSLRKHEEQILLNKKIAEERHGEDIKKLKETENEYREQQTKIGDDMREYYLVKSQEEEKTVVQRGGETRKPIFGSGPDPSAEKKERKRKEKERVDKEKDKEKDKGKDKEKDKEEDKRKKNSFIFI